MRFLVADTETAGMGPFACEQGLPYGGICELSVREVDRLTLNTQYHWHTKLHPEGPINPSAAGVHGILDQHVADKPTMLEYVREEDLFNSGMDTQYIIAHNAPFDRKFLDRYVTDTQWVWGMEPQGGEVFWVDTLVLARRIYPQSPDHKLQTLRVFLDLPFDVTDSHSAGGDTASLVELLKHMMATTGKGLLELCEWSQVREPVTTMPFGKHKGTLLTDMVKSDPGYLRWILKQDSMDPDLKEAVSKLMSRK